LYIFNYNFAYILLMTTRAGIISQSIKWLGVGMVHWSFQVLTYRGRGFYHHSSAQAGSAYCPLSLLVMLVVVLLGVKMSRVRSWPLSLLVLRLWRHGVVPPFPHLSSCCNT
jgi:hypothetical protein